MPITWLHVSDFHFRGGDPYDRNVVLKALIRSVKRFREREDRKPDLIFATGDIAHAGKPDEYAAATAFLDSLLGAAELEKGQLFVVPGNHDVDRELGIGLARTLDFGQQADNYFNPNVPKPHIEQKQRAFVAWYDSYFAGIRSFPKDTTCGPVEPVKVGGHTLGIVPINSALFCQSDDDHEKLWIGRRCLDLAASELQKLDANLRLALIHHPLDWLSGHERSNIKAKLQDHVDVILRGHLHETDIESVTGITGNVVHLAAGAAYQTRQWPNRALYVTFDGNGLTVFPIRYEDKPQEVWTVDTSVFPLDPDFQRQFAIPRLCSNLDSARAEPARSPSPPAALRSNIPSRRNLPFVGRAEVLAEIEGLLGDPSSHKVLVLRGCPGTGKSELAREYARLHQARYPGGTFVIDASSEVPIDLATIGSTILALDFPPGLLVKDQCLRSLYQLGDRPALLIYDNVRSPVAIEPWLPSSGMPYHVLITTVLDRWDATWRTLLVGPLGEEACHELILKLAGAEVTEKYGTRLAALAGGLPVQIVPAALTLEKKARRGRSEDAQLTITQEAQQSFSGVYSYLDADARLLLQAAALLNPQRIPRGELLIHLETACGWSTVDFDCWLDDCLDVHLLDGDADLRMHHLVGAFVCNEPAENENRQALLKVREVQARRIIEMAAALAAEPNRIDLAAALVAFPLLPEDWQTAGVSIAAEDGEMIGRALFEIGRFEVARPWFERAAKAKSKWDVNGRINHESVGASLQWVGLCLANSSGQGEAALPWFQRAVQAKEKGDKNGRIDYQSLGESQHSLGLVYWLKRQFDTARIWFERAAAAKKRGDVHGRINYANLGMSYHQLGWWLFARREFRLAEVRFKRAVVAKRKGDVRDRVDYDSIGFSLALIADCRFEAGDIEAALKWSECSVAAREKGDAYGRVDYASVGKGMHQVGTWLLTTDRPEEAKKWFDNALSAKNKGDIYGRLDHTSMGHSMAQIGYCFVSMGKTELALPQFELAIKAYEKGNVYVTTQAAGFFRWPGWVVGGR
ncbi:MAG: metallophosphoesterase [Defluviicoccus sp.]